MYRRLVTTVTAVAAALATVAVGASLTARAEEPTDPDVVTTTDGPVRGSLTDSGRGFQGIPYAAAPTGERRWRPPAPVEPWHDVRDATAPGAACVQPTDQPIAVPDGEEDCLYLNVTTPTESRERKPVIVWIHGGSFTYGDGAGYDAARLAERGDAVVVTVNYRLGAFGFLSHPTLTESGNLGLEDQQAALRWVRANAAAFGGDKRDVTIMGESGGGYSVCGHLASRDSAGLFDKAIIHSAGCVGSGDAAVTREQAEADASALLAELDCADAACLRAKGADEILAAAESGHEGYRLISGTDTLPVSPGEAITSGKVNRVPVLHGSNRDEENGRLAGMELATGKPVTAADYEQQVRETFGGDAEAVLARYPLSDYDTPSNALGAVLTDAAWSTPSFDTQTALAKRMPTYAFEVAGRAPWFDGMERPGFEIGTGHMQELAYLFDYDLFADLDAKQRELSNTMIDYWARFVHKGDMNASGLPKWKQFKHHRPYTQQLSTAAVGRTDFAAEHHHEFWKSRER